MQITKTLPVLAVFALFTLPAGAYAQAPSISADKFVQTVAMSDVFEVESSKLAASRSKDERVKKFADHMVKDHQKTTQELKQLLGRAKINVPLPSGADPEHQAMLGQLQSATGNQFDETYAKMQLKGHEDAVALFENYARNGDHPELKKWAAKTLPNLKEHLSEARHLRGGATTGSSSSPASRPSSAPRR
jgi:putative membrane protein